MKPIPYISLKIARVIGGVFLLASIGIVPLLQAEEDPVPSQSVGGRTIVINNRTNYRIAIRDLVMWNPHHDRGSSSDMGKTIPAKTEGVVLGPTDSCRAGMAWWTSSCFWGAKGKSDTFKISSDDFPDKNATYDISISQGAGKKILQSKEASEEKGCCTFPVLSWKSVWVKDHQEITFEACGADTSLIPGYGCEDCTKGLKSCDDI